MKIQNRHFYPSFNSFNQVQLKKNLMNRFTEKFESVDVGSKNGPFKQNKIFFPEKGFHHFLVFIESQLLCKTKQNKVISQL